MNTTAKKAGVAQELRGVSQFLRDVLVSVDLSAMSDRVLSRVARLPFAATARVTLLHVVPERLSGRARERAERDAKRALVSAAAELGPSLPAGVATEWRVERGAPAAEIAACASATKAELIVVGRGGARALRDTFLGSTAERVMRRARVPVLAVRLPPRVRYQRPVVAIELDAAAPSVLTTMLKLLPPPRPRVALIHAFDAPFQGIVYPSLSEDDAEEWLSELQGEATRQLEQLVGASLAKAKVRPEDAPRWKHYVRSGSARTVIEKAVRKHDADLLVLGTHGRAGVAHALLGSVAGDVLRSVSCDVLVVPGPR